MIAYETKTGTITVSNEYFAKLIGNATSSCFGVAGMAPHGDLHIIVAYGMNINAIAKSITEKVKYVVTEATGISVGKVTVRIDGIKE